MLDHPNLSLNFWSKRRVPFFMQSEAAECGLACIAMIANYWGHKIDLASMRHRFSISVKGATLKSLMDIGSSLHLESRPLKVELDQIPHLQCPCILHWDVTHFVVLTKANKVRVSIFDPAIGPRIISINELSRHFTGIAVELSPTESFTGRVETREVSIRALMGRVIGLRRGLLQILALGTAVQVFSLAAPFYLQWVVDQAIVSNDKSLLTVLGIGFCLLVIIQTAISFVRGWVTSVLSTSLNFQWLGNTFSHMMKLPLSYFERRHLGDVVSRFNSIQTIQRSLTTQFVDAIIDGALVLSAVVVMMMYSFQLSAIAIFTAFLYVALRLAVFRKLRDATAEQIVHTAKQQTILLESIRGVQAIRLFGRSSERKNTWLNSLASQFNTDLSISRFSISFQSANTLMFGLEKILVIWVAATLVLESSFSVGMLFAFVSYKEQFSYRFSQLVDRFLDFRMLQLHGQRIADLVLSDTEEASTKNFLARSTPENISIELKGIKFRYGDDEPLVIENIDLTIESGECIAITGPSGSGKTTLIKILLGLLTPTEGEILVGGVSLQQIGLDNYRKLIGAVMQEDQLFSGTISENISFFDPGHDQKRVEECARLGNR